MVWDGYYVFDIDVSKWNTSQFSYRRVYLLIHTLEDKFIQLQQRIKDAEEDVMLALDLKQWLITRIVSNCDWNRSIEKWS